MSTCWILVEPNHPQYTTQRFTAAFPLLYLYDYTKIRIVIPIICHPLNVLQRILLQSNKIKKKHKMKKKLGVIGPPLPTHLNNGISAGHWC